MPYLDSVEELLEAKEGEHVQFKEAKNRFDFGEAARCCCALANDGGVWHHRQTAASGSRQSCF